MAGAKDEGETRRCKALVVGAGPAGLAAARHLLDAGGLAAGEVVVLEEASQVGGLWNREDRVNEGWLMPQAQGPSDRVGPSSPDLSHLGAEELQGLQERVAVSSQPVYESLRTNLPKEMMACYDFPFDDSLEDFPTAAEVQAYLERFAAAHALARCIRFRHRVRRCIKTGGRWRVHATDPASAEVAFDADWLVVCSGHQRRAFLPWDTPGLAGFPGRLEHSSAFVRAAGYAGESVLVVGGSISGGEILSMLAQSGCCRHVAVSVRHMKPKYKQVLKKPLRQGVALHGGIRQIRPDGVVEFDDGSTAAPTVIIFATGYLYDTAFVDAPPTGAPFCPSGTKMAHLFHRMFYAYDPSLVFLGITNDNLSPMNVFDAQSYLLARVVAGAVALPSQDAMLAEVATRAGDTTADRLLLGTPAYCNALSALSGFPGYWTQVCHRRAWWFLRSSLRRRPVKTLAFLVAAAVAAYAGGRGVSGLARRAMQWLRGAV